MTLTRLAGMLLVNLVIVACASAPRQAQEVMTPPQRIVANGVSFLPLNEQGWFIISREPYALALAKRGGGPDESFAIQVALGKLPSFDSTEQFVHLVNERLAASDPKRFQTEKEEVTAITYKGASCVRSSTVTIDKNADRASGRTGSMVLEAMMLVCVHPKDPHVGVVVTYSHRHYPDQSDPNFSSKADQIMNSIEFTDVTGKPTTDF